MRSQLEDMKGLRRGTVRIACSQALAHDFLPQQIASFRQRHPLMTFDVNVADHEHAIGLLVNYEVDLILVFRPPFVARLRPLMTLPQRVVALLPADHTLAARPKVRLADCAGYPLALSERSTGGRQMIEERISRSGLRFSVMAQSNSFELLRGLVAHCGFISFQIEVGAQPPPCRRESSCDQWTSATCPPQTLCSASCADAACRWPGRSSPNISAVP